MFWLQSVGDRGSDGTIGSYDHDFHLKIYLGGVLRFH